MRQNIFETLFGGCVFLIAVFFVIHVVTVAQFSRQSHYQIVAEFPQIDGLSIGDDILMSGIKVGYISDLKLIRNPFRISAILEIRDDVQLWQDAVATVSTVGLFDGKYIALDPGGGEDVLIKPGEKIIYTQGSILLDETLWKMVEIGQRNHQGEASASTLMQEKPKPFEQDIFGSSLGLE